MFVVRIEYLTGRCVATAFNDRREPEWPPHPARFFSALVAAWAEGEPPNEEERAALEWLECLDPPAIAASEADHRPAMQTFVPTNDATVIATPPGKMEQAITTARIAVDQARQQVADATETGPVKAIQKADKDLARAEAQLAKVEQTRRDFVAASVRAEDKPAASTLETARALLPERRNRQPRYFPSVTPLDPVVHLIWSDTPPPRLGAALDHLLARVTRLGHSSSLVTCTTTAQAPAPTLLPATDGASILRVPAPGQLAQLVIEHERHRGIEPRVLPCRFVRYGEAGSEPTAPPARGVFSADWIILRRVGGPRLPATAGVRVANAVRGALQSHAEQPPPRVLSGHEVDGTPARGPHLAIIPLPFVGHEHADGAILGVALALPADLPVAERLGALRALGQWEAASRGEASDEETPTLPIQLGAAGVLEVERLAWGEAQQSTLRTSTWCKPARTWVTATPIALDRNPGDLFADNPATAEAAYQEAAASIAESCRNIGLPAPSEVTILPSVSLAGTTKARHYPPFPPQAGRVRRVKVHARLRFAEPVAGPVLLGAGRYLGLGLLRPLDERD